VRTAPGAPGSLAHLRGFVFDLDGCVWNGSALEPGAREALAALHGSGRAIGFLSNNSRAFGGDLRRCLHGHGITFAEHVLTPLEIIGEFIAERFGRSRALVMGAAELAEAVRRGGHDVVDFDHAREATVVVVGNDMDVSYARITAAARAAAAGAPLMRPISTRDFRWREAISFPAVPSSSRPWPWPPVCGPSWWASPIRRSFTSPCGGWA
jgi:ribonucleotide monophosphatase NagD (HAD superfamily)